MVHNTTDLTFASLRSAMTGALLSEAEKSNCTEENVRAAFRLAKAHDLDHLVAWSLKNNGFSDMLGAHGEKKILTSVYRYQQIKYEYERICPAFEAAGIDFLPLKGSVIRKHYPEPWMRTSCDIDILIHQDDIERAKTLLMAELNYTYSGATSHDVSLYSQSGVHLELHYDLIEDGLVKESRDVLLSVWEDTCVKEGCAHWREMPDSLFYFYHVAHMAKHVLHGGCGIKPFIDLWILDNLEDADRDGRKELLLRGGLYKFACVALDLSHAWFGNKKHDGNTLNLEKFVLEGGVYGSEEQLITVQKQKNGGSIRYILSLIWKSSDSLKHKYPILKKHRWLLPFVQVRRWFDIVLEGRFKSSVRKINTATTITDAEVDAVEQFLSSIELL